MYDNIAVKLLCLAVYFHDLEAQDSVFFILFSIFTQGYLQSLLKKKSLVRGVGGGGKKGLQLLSF